MVRKYFGILALVMLSPLLKAQSTADSVDFRKLLNGLGSRFGQALVRRDLSGVMTIYAPDAVRMPEFHLACRGKEAVGRYWREWMDSANLVNYREDIDEIIGLKNWVVERGTFLAILAKGKGYNYQGKYLRVWRILSSEKLELVSEITGSSGFVDRSDLPLSALTATPLTDIPSVPASPVLTEVTQLSARVAELVKKGDGPAFAPFYTEDAVYMPYYMPPLLGKAAINEYYIGHESPNAGIDSVSIGITRLIDLGGLILTDGLYAVHGSVKSGGWLVTGKILSIWKRNEQGKLLEYRQMTVHD